MPAFRLTVTHKTRQCQRQVQININFSDNQQIFRNGTQKRTPPPAACLASEHLGQIIIHQQNKTEQSLLSVTLLSNTLKSLQFGWQTYLREENIRKLEENIRKLERAVLMDPQKLKWIVSTFFSISESVSRKVCFHFWFYGSTAVFSGFCANETCTTWTFRDRTISRIK